MDLTKKYSAIGLRLKKLRDELTLHEFAQRFKVPVRTYLRYETGERSPSLEMLTDVAIAYQVSLDWILLGIGEERKQMQKQKLDKGRSSELIAMYDNRCAVCGTEGKLGTFLEAVHIKQRGKRGEDQINNLIVLCPNCHRRFEHDETISKDLLRYLASNKSRKKMRRAKTTSTNRTNSNK